MSVFGKHPLSVLSDEPPSKQKFVGERRRSQLAELEIGAAAARMAILLSR
jgi:hypothetical protein